MNENILSDDELIKNMYRALKYITSFVKCMVNKLLARSYFELTSDQRNETSILQNFYLALDWVDKNTNDKSGVKVCADSVNAYPEVTGYYIPTLLNWGERKRAIEFATWLISIQNPDGSWFDPEGKTPYTFDTGQILKGLLAILPFIPEAEHAIRKGCNWILTLIEPIGRITTPDKSEWALPNGNTVSENIHLYALEPLRKASIIFNEPCYEEAVQRALAYYLKIEDLTDFNTLAHFHAYVLEALVDLGYPDIAAKGMAEIERLQRSDGSIPAYPDVKWVCSTAIAQYAVVWYKLGNRNPAKKALDYLCRLQNTSGGFYGSYGRGAHYFQDKEISWAVKYFLDAYYWHIRTAFDEEVSIFPETIELKDGRVQAIVEGLGNGNIEGLKILDAACGKGRFSRTLYDLYPTAEFWGVDISDAMLRCVPPGIKTMQGSLLNLPFTDDSFDRVFSVEALEHSVNPEVAIQELCRVLKKGGRMVIIDKNEKRKGALQIESWERWFSKEEVEAWLSRECINVRSAFVSYADKTSPDGLFIAWYGTKR
ncbi:MAG: hypothetical protein RLZZ419_920 [Pseudomonadota bacterium]